MLAKEAVDKVRTIIDDRPKGYHNDYDPNTARNLTRYTDADILAALNDAQARLCLENSEDFRKNADFVIDAETATWTFPVDFLKTDRFFVNGYRVDHIDGHQINTNDTTNYYITLTDEAFTLHNAPDSGALRLYYFYQLPRLDSVDDFIGPASNVAKQAITHMAARWLLQQEGNERAAQVQGMELELRDLRSRKGGRTEAMGTVESALDTYGFTEKRRNANGEL